MAKRKRRILKGMISYISLCPRGANQIQTVYKADGGKDTDISLATLVKGDINEKGELLAVVYAVDKTDSQGDTASAEVVKQMAYDFARDGVGIDIRHNEEVLPKDDIFIAESFLIQKNDSRFADTKDYSGKTVDVTGGWGVVLKINNEELRKQYRDGGWGGISMGGLMLAKPETSDTTIIMKLLEKISGLIPGTEKHKILENDMDEKELKAMEDRITKSVLTGLAEAKKAEAEEVAKKAAEKAKDEPKLGMGLVQPVLKGSSDEAIEEHTKNMEIFELSKAVDSSDITAVRAFQLMRKAIVEGKEVSMPTKKGDKTPYDAFSTNQSTGQIQNVVKIGDDPMADAILLEMDKEDAAELVAGHKPNLQLCG